MRTVVNDHDPIQLSSEPVIDFSALLSQDSQIKNEVIKEIGKACEDFDFFSVISNILI